MKELVFKSIIASFVVSIGMATFFSAPSPLGAILFAFGLIAICNQELNLFTGKSWLILYNTPAKEVFLILAINAISAYFFGYLLNISNPEFYTLAINKMANWNWSLQTFIQAFMCGAIMFFCVTLHKSNQILGIVYGVPAFIWCGFHHCIANMVVMGMASSFNGVIILHIFGNFVGALTFACMMKK